MLLSSLLPSESWGKKEQSTFLSRRPLTHLHSWNVFTILKCFCHIPHHYIAEMLNGPGDGNIDSIGEGMVYQLRVILWGEDSIVPCRFPSRFYCLSPFSAFRHFPFRSRRLFAHTNSAFLRGACSAQLSQTTISLQFSGKEEKENNARRQIQTNVGGGRISISPTEYIL